MKIQYIKSIDRVVEYFGDDETIAGDVYMVVWQRREGDIPPPSWCMSIEEMKELHEKTGEILYG